MKKLKAVTVILLIFVLGTLAGSLGTKIYLKNRFLRFAGGPPPHSLNIIMDKLTEDLDLTKDQQAKIKPILEQSLDNFAKRRKEFLPQMHGPLSRNFAKIREFLTDEQKKKMDAILAKRFRNLPMKHLPRIPPENMPPEQFVDIMAERLHLSGEQLNNIRPILENSFKEQQALVQKNRQLRQESRKMYREGMDKIRNTTAEQLKPYLSEDQLKEFDEINDDRPEIDRFDR